MTTSHGKESVSSLTVFPYGMIVPASPASATAGGVIPGPSGYLPYPFPGTSAQMICEFARAPSHFQLYDYQARLQRLGFQGYTFGTGHGPGGLGAFQPGPGSFLSYLYGKHERPGASYPAEEPKPSHSYIGIIAMAILSSKEKKLVLSDIYQWILDNYPYFRRRGPGWRNSIRHNLSLNDCFVKSGRSANGKGHYWAIHPANMDDFQKGDFRRRRAQRKVRKAMGLAVPDDEDSPSPSPTPTAALQEWQARMFGIGVGPGGGASDSGGRGERNPDGVDSPVESLTFASTPPPPLPALPPPSLTAATESAEGARSVQQMTQRCFPVLAPPQRSLQTILPRQTLSKKRLFDVESLLAPDADDPETEVEIHQQRRLFLQTSSGLRLAVDRTHRRVALLTDDDGNRRDFPKTIDLSLQTQTKMPRLDHRKRDTEEKNADENGSAWRRNEEDMKEEEEGMKKTDEEERNGKEGECLIIAAGRCPSGGGPSRTAIHDLVERDTIDDEGEVDDEGPSKAKAEDMTVAYLDKMQRSAEASESSSSSPSFSAPRSEDRPEVTVPSAFRFDVDTRKEEEPKIGRPAGDDLSLPSIIDAKSSSSAAAAVAVGDGADGFLMRTRFHPLQVGSLGRAVRRHDDLLLHSPSVAGSGRLVQSSAGAPLSLPLPSTARPGLVLHGRSHFPSRFPFQMQDGRSFLLRHSLSSTPTCLNQRGSI